MKQHELTKKELLAVGLMLFALFFGAGNMIFPPALGQQAGTNTFVGIGGFLLTGVGLPLLGIIAASRIKGDFSGVAKRVHPVFGLCFTFITYLTIGPFFGIPRTGTVAFQIGVTPFLNEAAKNSGTYLFIYTVIFFGITLWLAMNPSKIVDTVGKILTPLLLGVLTLLVIKSLITPMGSFQPPQQAYANAPFFKGFLDGYLTMDAIAALVFGIVVITSIKDKGITDPKRIASTCMKAGVIAAVGLALVYISLAYIGASSVSSIGVQTNGGDILTNVAKVLFGPFGITILAIAITFACLTTSIGLLTACGEFLSKQIRGLSYRVAIMLISIFSLVVSNVGLTKLISISTPLLTFLYPIAIILIILSLVDKNFGIYQEVYIGSVTAGAVISFFDALNAAQIPLGPINQFLTRYVPLYENQMGWLIPSILVGFIGWIIGYVRRQSAQAK
ncbi:branched-chain amino acid transport system II carrier protein [Priestia koreensis]|uniref:branched-chain amino acid transport system II carrier protein n=1 Tax=Priestia koreensis TaxID=284581 RepID=UPI001F57900A|nr:branched-chain amino acid transport system II carrier protein [Priestia koreensis]UNL84505.1 branched-chain amino acid transport system II carrier protein [Priestia koreensis]